MKMTFRWYGESDPVSLDYIRQIPSVEGVVTALYDSKVGEVWSEESIAKIKAKIQVSGLNMEVIESVPVHEDIKLGYKNRDKYIDNYIENIRRLARAGVKCICYNFMPVFDWTRTNLAHKNSDGSTSLIYDERDLVRMDPMDGELALPGWDTSYEKGELARLFDAYKEMSNSDLMDNLGYFLHRIIPVAEECGVNMAIHPDDPPWDIFGLPRIVKSERNIDKILALYPSPRNGLTFCTGSLGASDDNDVVSLVDKYAKMKRIHFMHIRNILLTDDGFMETAHSQSAGSLDIVGVIKALHRNDYDGYIRPDHGRNIFGEDGKPGYGLYDRALGASYISGVWDALERCNYE